MPNRPAGTSQPGRGPGPLVAIGGAEDKLGRRRILERFVSLAGGPSVTRSSPRTPGGAVVGGTSAGASILSSHMVAFGPGAARGK